MLCELTPYSIEVASLKIDLSQIYRYLGMPTITYDEQIEANITRLLPLFISSLNPKGVFRSHTLSIANDDVLFVDTTFHSHHLACHLANCHKAYLLACTLGSSIDKLLARFSLLSPSDTLILQALSTIYIEAVADHFQALFEENEQPAFSSLRYSPGYGDLSLSYQTDVFRLLSCEKRIQLTLKDTLIMAPSKSITAFIGFRHNHIDSPHACITCTHPCEYRKDS